MENKTLTAVEWLIEQLQAPCRGIPSHIIDQAKQMEKEQIVDAQMDMFHHINNLPYGMEYLNKRDSAEEFCNTYVGQGSPDTTTSPTK